MSQRGGTTYSASLSGKGVPVSLNYSLNVNGGKQTNTFGVSIQLPGTEHFSNVRGSLSYNDRLGLSSGVSYNIGKGESPKPMTEAERAQYNLLDDLIGGLGSVVSGIGRGVKSVWDGVFGGDAPLVMMPIGMARGGVNPQSNVDEEKIIQDLILKDRGSKEGIIGELTAKGEMGLLTNVEKDQLFKLISAKETMKQYDELMLSGHVDFDSLSPQAKAEYLKSAKFYLDAERAHSLVVLSNWKSDGLKEVPLTPYANRCCQRRCLVLI